MSRTTTTKSSVLRLVALLFLFVFATGTASAQTYWTEPNGDGPACTAADPGRLQTCLDLAQGDAVASTVVFEAGEYRVNRDYDINNGVDLFDPGPTNLSLDITGAAGTVQFSGGTVAVGNRPDALGGIPELLSLEDGFTMRISSNTKLTLFEGSTIMGVGSLVQLTGGIIEMDQSDTGVAENTDNDQALIENLTVEGGGRVQVVDALAGESPAELVIFNRFRVRSGTFATGGQRLRYVVDVADLGLPAVGNRPFFEIASGARVEGAGLFSFEVAGDEGVAVRDFSTTGGGEVKTDFLIEGTGANIGSVWVSFSAFENIDVTGIGDDTVGGAEMVSFTSAINVADGDLTLDDSRVVLERPSTIEENLVLNEDSDLELEVVASASGGVTQVGGDIDTDDSGEPKSIRLFSAVIGGTRYWHNLGVAGDLNFENSDIPVFVMEDPAELLTGGFNNACAVLGADQSVSGNRLIINGGSDSSIIGPGNITLASLEIKKTDDGDDVVIEDVPGNATRLTITEALLVSSGTLETNGRLIMTGADLAVTNRNGNRGRIVRGDGDSAYIDETSGPSSIIFLGNQQFATGGELPGEEDEVTVSRLIVATENPAATVTIDRDIDIIDQLALCAGRIDVGSSNLIFNLGMDILVRDGEITRAGNPGLQGAVVFPTVFEVDDPAVNQDNVGGTADDPQAGEDGIDLVYVSTVDRAVSLEFPSADFRPFVIRDVTINAVSGVEIALRDGQNFRINGDLLVHNGSLDLSGQRLELYAVNSFDTVVELDNPANPNGDGSIISSDADATTGVLAFRGEELTSVTGFTDSGGGMGTFSLPNVVVNKVGNRAGGVGVEDEFRVEFMVDDDPVPSPDGERGAEETFALRSLLIQNANTNSGDNADPANNWGVTFHNSVDHITIATDYTQIAGSMLREGGGGRTMVVMGDFLQQGDRSLFSDGSQLWVVNDFVLGTATTSARLDGGDDSFRHVVGEGTGGDYWVNGGSRYILSSGVLTLYGDYAFLGVGDVTDGPEVARGLRGEVVFAGATNQGVRTSETPEAQFPSVTLRGEGNLELASDMTLNETGDLQLNFGIVDTQEGQFAVTLMALRTEDLGAIFGGALNRPDDDPAGTLNVVELGSRDSFVDGAVTRRISGGQSTGGNVLSGYFFPVGQLADETPNNRNVFAPLVLQFGTQGRTSFATVTTLHSDSMDAQHAMEMFEPFRVDGGFSEEEPLGTGADLILNTLGSLFYKLEFDQIPSEDPNIRIIADFLPRGSIEDINALRIVQLPCADGPQFAPRLAGVYDLQGSSPDDASAFLNDFVNGIPNVIQEGVSVETCQVLSIATNRFINPIDDPGTAARPAFVQVIHNSPDLGTIDIYVDGDLFVNDLGFREATGLELVRAGAAGTSIVVTAGNAPNANTPLLSVTAPLTPEQAYVVSVNGPRANLRVLTQEARPFARNDGQVEFFIVNGAPAAGTADIRVVDETSEHNVDRLLANNLAYGEQTGYMGVDPMAYNIDLASADGATSQGTFRFDLGGYEGESLTMLTSGSAGTNDVMLIAFDVLGNLILPQVVTAIDEVEVPTAFSLKGNYPNPFNPSTAITFDLPAAADVSLEIYDMLGRQVMALPLQAMTAGANRTLQINAANLASGMYLYRVVAKMAQETKVGTGRMTLIK